MTGPKDASGQLKPAATTSGALVRSVLIAKLSSMGDVVCTLPVAGLVRRLFPEAKITWAVDPHFGAIVRNCTWVDEVIELKVSPLAKSWEAVHRPFDAVLEMQGLGKSAWLALAAQSKIKLGYHWQREGSWIVSRRVVPDPSSLHVVDQYVDVARQLGAMAGLHPDEGTVPFGLVASPDDLASVNAKLEAKKAGARFAVINPGGAWATKRWRPESFAAIALGLETMGIAIVLIGSQSVAEAEAEAILLQEAMRIGAHPVSLRGKTSIGELIALLSLAKMHIGGDTGSTHIAAALDVPAIGLYSITRPERSCPYRQWDNCLYNSKGLDAITVDEVMAKIKKIAG